MIYVCNEAVSVKELADLRESIGWNRMENEYKNPLLTSYYHIAVKGLFEETETDYIGNPIRNYITLREPETFSKTDWELVLKPLDRVLCTHIF